MVLKMVFIQNNAKNDCTNHQFIPNCPAFLWCIVDGRTDDQVPVNYKMIFTQSPFMASWSGGRTSSSDQPLAASESREPPVAPPSGRTRPLAGIVEYSRSCRLKISEEPFLINPILHSIKSRFFFDQYLSFFQGIEKCESSLQFLSAAARTFLLSIQENMYRCSVY